MKELIDYLQKRKKDYMDSAKECKKNQDYLGLVALGAKANAINDVLKFLNEATVSEAPRKICPKCGRNGKYIAFLGAYICPVCNA